MNATTASVPPVLLPLVDYLGRLKARASLHELNTRLRSSRVTLADVHDFAQFDLRHYRRNLVAQGTWFSLLVLCWRSGQRSPIHDHAGSTCAFKVLTGVCSETIYAFAPCGQVVPQKTRDCLAGTIVSTQDADTHQVSNLQPAGCDLVTLHIYSPPLNSMHRFSILGAAGNDGYALDGIDPDIADGGAI